MKESVTHRSCRIGDVFNQGSQVGWAFLVKGEADETLFWMTYPTEAAARAAHKLIAQALEGAAFTPGL
jgi:hypothetical protein